MVHEAVAPGFNPIVFKGVPRQVRILGPYNNDQLPDLRARFVQDDFVLPYIAECRDVARKVRILKGHVFSKKFDRLERKVLVHINFFDS